MAAGELDAGLHERVRSAVDRARRLGRETAILLESSRFSRDDRPLAPQCASCGRIGVGGAWLTPEDAPEFLLRVRELELEPGICPDCFGAPGEPEASSHRHARLTIHAGGRRASDALVEALGDYGVKRHRDGVLEVELGEAHGAAAVNGLLTLIANCLRDQKLDPVQVRLTDRSYTLDGGG